jgi:outer membrane protein TolC
MTRPVVLAVLFLGSVAPALAQQPAATLQLGDLYQAAVATDPRTAQLALLDTQTGLRLRNISALRLPTFTVEGQAQYQSDVPHVPLPAGGRPLFQVPKDTYDGYVRIDQRLFDPSVSAQAALERAQLAEQQARVRSAVFSVRQQVNEAFFAAATLQERAGVLAASVADLEGRLRETEARVREGTAVGADAAFVEATLLQRRQDEDELRSARRAALARLSTIVGRPIAEDVAIGLPELSPAVATARQSPATVRSRPEFAQFTSTRDRLARQQSLALSATRPRLSAYARIGAGQPGLNFVGGEFQTYALGGVRLQWNAWNWGATRREGDALAIQQQIVAADEQAFAKGILEVIENDAATVDRLQRALAMDQRIVELRQQVEGTTRVRMQEGVVTMSEYLARNAELVQARFAQAQHRVELAQASARVLTTLGVEIR